MKSWRVTLLLIVLLASECIGGSEKIEHKGTKGNDPVSKRSGQIMAGDFLSSDRTCLLPEETGNVLLRVSPDRLHKIVRRYRLHIVRKFSGEFYLLRPEDLCRLHEIVERLQNDDEVQSAQPDSVRQIQER